MNTEEQNGFMNGFSYGQDIAGRMIDTDDLTVKRPLSALKGVEMATASNRKQPVETIRDESDSHRERRALAGLSRNAVSPQHQDIYERSAKFSYLSPGLRFGWADTADYLPAFLDMVPKKETNIFTFKDGWIAHNRDAIVSAASAYDIPPELLAGVAHNEVGGNPPGEKALLYFLRTHYPFRWPGALAVPAGQTSFGDIAIQPRRAAEALGADWRLLSEPQRNALLDSLRNPVENLHISAKHLSDLRDLDFKGVSASQLTFPQISAIGARYNAGPQYTVDELMNIKSAKRYGELIAERWDKMARLLDID